MIHKVEANEISEDNALCLNQNVGDLIFSIQSTVGGIAVGSLTAVIRSEITVQLSDVEVSNAVDTSCVPFLRYVRKWKPRFGMTSFRGRNIGTKMLVCFLDWCRANGKIEVFGTVVQEDLNETPDLLGWYQRHGFEVRPPDDRCLRNAVCMIVWRNYDLHSSGGSES